MRKTNFANGEFYHIFNRGVDKRDIFSDQHDLQRFFQSMNEFNTVEPIGSIFENRFKEGTKNPLGHPASKLVNFVAFCLNPNHFHFILEQVEDKGIEKFIHRLAMGYSKYFNNRHKRSGTLFQGPFRSIHVDSNGYLLHLSVYVNLNDKQSLQSLGHPASKLSKSSWAEYLGKGDSREYFCKKDIILGQFSSIDDYEKFALGSLEGIKLRKEQEKELEEFI